MQIKIDIFTYDLIQRRMTALNQAQSSVAERQSALVDLIQMEAARAGIDFNPQAPVNVKKEKDDYIIEFPDPPQPPTTMKPQLVPPIASNDPLTQESAQT